MELPLRLGVGLFLTSWLLHPHDLVGISLLPVALAQDLGEDDRERLLPPDPADILRPDEEEDRPSPFEPYLHEDLEIAVAPEALLEFGHNLDLDDAEDSDLGIAELVLNVGIGYEPSDAFLAVLAVSATHENTFVAQEEDEDLDFAFEVEEAYLRFSDVVDNLALQVGRQYFTSEREWLYGEELDAVRLFYEAGGFLLDMSASREDAIDADIFSDDVSDDEIYNYILSSDYRILEDVTVGAYAILRDGRVEEEGEPLFLGARSFGEPVEGFTYWLDLGHVRGEENSTDIRGFAADVGATYVFDLPLEPAVTLAYAWGSGDSDPDDGTNRAYRQTGLQENEYNFAGIPNFQYYGEVFDPELSNLHIFTAGIGIRDGDTSSVDLVYHYYRQAELADEIFDSNIDADLSSPPRSRDLGSEIDLVVGYRNVAGIANFGVDFALGYFFPGRAFPEDTDDGAVLGRLEFAYGF